MTRIRELDGLRFFAICAVIGIHYRPPFRPALDILSLGWAGVDLFFVLSGFLITTILLSLRKSEKPFLVFYWRRILRIFPPYYAVLFAITLLAALSKVHFSRMVMLQQAFFFTAVDFNQIGQIASRIIHLTPLTGIDPLPIDDHIFSQYDDGIGISWSLSIEELFYLLWAPVVLKCSLRKIATVGIGAVVLCPLLRILDHRADYPEYFQFFTRFDTLMIGCLLAVLMAGYGHRPEYRSRLLTGLISLGAVSAVLLALLSILAGILRHMEIRSALIFSGFGYSFLGSFFGAVIGLCVLYAQSGVWWARLLRSKPLVYIGTVSYMMYLIHTPVFVTVYKVVANLGHPEGTMIPTLRLGLLAFMATLLISGLSWRFFEQPILRLKKRLPI